MRELSGNSKRLFFVVRPMVYALKIIGLAPFRMSSEASAEINPYDSHIEVFQYSKIGLAYNIFFIIPGLTVVAIIFHVPNHLAGSYSNESFAFNAEAVLHTTESILRVFAACVVIIHWGCKQRDAASIMNRLFEVGCELSVLKQQPSNKHGIIFVAMHVIANASLWITFWIRKIVFHLDDLLDTLFGRFPDYIIYWFIIEYFTVVALIAQYLRSVNDCLLDFNEFGNYLSRPRVADSPGIPGVVNLRNDRSSQLSSLKLLHSVRTKLSELCEDVSNFFSLPILFCIADCFVPLVYEIYTVSIVSNNASFSAARVASYTFVIICLYIYPVLSLSLNVTRTCKESKRTGPIIHKLLVTPIGQEIRAELTQFSVQLLHEDLKFTACGFFALDSTLLLSMLGGVASYFVVLTQFKSACTCKSSNIT